MSARVVVNPEPGFPQESGTQLQDQAEIRWESGVEKWLHARRNSVVFVVLAAGFLARLYAAATTYLNPDEAFHYIILNQDSALFAYKVSLTNAHPPLIYLLVHYWSFLGRSELMLRLPSVLAGTVFCWAAYKWIGILFGKTAGIIGLILVSFSPILIALSAQLRSYALVLCFETVALYLMEEALEQKSVRKMVYFALFLYLAILSHYSAVFFVFGVGIYALARLVEARSPRGLVGAWISGQVGAVGIYWFLYVTHVSRLKLYIQSWQVSFDQNYSHTGHEHLLAYAWDRTADIFLFLFDNQFLVQGLFLIWLVSLVLLVRESVFRAADLRTRYAWILLVLPVLAIFLAGVFGYYPYIGSRHTVFLAPFLIAPLCFLIATISGRKLWAGVTIAALLACATHTGGKLSEPYLTKENQRLGLMKDAVKYIQQTIPSDERIVTDYQSAIMFVYDFCGPQPNSSAWRI